MTVAEILNTNFRQHTCIALLAMVCFLGVLLILAIIPPSAGYENSMYQIYPLSFWILTGIIYLLPLLYVYLSNKSNPLLVYQKKTVYFLLMISLVTILLCFSLPLIRGYFAFTAGDTLSHFGYIQDIIESGHISLNNLYPFIHLFIGAFVLLSNQSASSLSLLTIPLFYFLFVISIFCLTRRLHFSHLQSVTITSIAILPVMATWFCREPLMPSTLGFEFLPIIICCILGVLDTTFSHRYLIAYTILAVAAWIIHPEMVLYVSLLLFTLFFISMLYKKKLNKLFFEHTPSNIIYLILFGAICIGFIYQFIQTSSFALQFTLYINVLFEHAEMNTPLSALQSDADIFRKITLLVIQYGQVIISVVVALFFTIYMLFTKKLFENKRYLLICSCFIAFGILASLFTVLGGATGLYIYRQYKFPYLFIVFLLGLLFTDIVIRKDNVKIKRIFSGIFIFIIILLTVFSIGNFYSAPEQHLTHYQITHATVSGMETFYEVRNDQYLIWESRTLPQQHRYYDYLYGLSSGIGINIRGLSSDYSKMIPANGFGYDEYETMGEQYNNIRYYLSYPPYCEYLVGFSSSDYPLNLTPEAYKHLNNDPTVTRIMDMGDALRINIIHPR
jgi:hypothetical protein